MTVMMTSSFIVIVTKVAALSVFIRNISAINMMTVLTPSYFLTDQICLRAWPNDAICLPACVAS